MNNQKLHRFIETYHAPFTFKQRYWTGLLLFVHIILYMVSAVNVTGDPRVTLVSTNILLVVLPFVKGIFKRNIYRKRLLDITEMIIYFNIISFAVLILYTYDTRENQASIAYISVMIMFSLFLIVIIFHVFRYTCLLSVTKKIIVFIAWKKHHATLAELPDDKDRLPLISVEKYNDEADHTLLTHSDVVESPRPSMKQNTADKEQKVADSPHIVLLGAEKYHEEETCDPQFNTETAKMNNTSFINKTKFDGKSTPYTCDPDAVPKVMMSAESSYLQSGTADSTASKPDSELTSFTLPLYTQPLPVLWCRDLGESKVLESEYVGRNDECTFLPQIRANNFLQSTSTADLQLMPRSSSPNQEDLKQKSFSNAEDVSDHTIKLPQISPCHPESHSVIKALIVESESQDEFREPSYIQGKVKNKSLTQGQPSANQIEMKLYTFESPQQLVQLPDMEFKDVNELPLQHNSECTQDQYSQDEVHSRDEHSPIIKREVLIFNLHKSQHRVSMYYWCAKNVASVPFIDPVTVLECDSSGREYTNLSHDITLRVPENAIPHGSSVHIEVATALFGPFKFQEDRRPISPILWICPQENIIFQKPIEVILPHILNNQVTAEDVNHFGLQFFKADHNDYSTNLDGHHLYNFKPFDANMEFFHELYGSFGVLQTTHCCFLCITAIKNAELSHTMAQKKGYCLSCIECLRSPYCNVPPRDVVYFCTSFFLKTCLQVRFLHGDQINQHGGMHVEHSIVILCQIF